MKTLITSAKVESKIHIIRDQSVMLDSDLAQLYGVPSKRLNEQVKRNLKRFPADFMFQLNAHEAEFLRSQIATASKRNIRYRPFAFTELGVAMLSSVLNSPRAVAVNNEIMRAFVRLRGFQFNYAAVRREIEKMKKKYDGNFWPRRPLNPASTSTGGLMSSQRFARKVAVVTGGMETLS